MTPQERRITFECDQGECPECGATRGFAVPDWCDHASCPDGDDIEELIDYDHRSGPVSRKLSSLEEWLRTRAQSGKAASPDEIMHIADILAALRPLITVIEDTKTLLRVIEEGRQ